jgi:hypothetical protein
MTRNRHAAIWAARILTIVLAAATAIGVAMLATTDACYESTQTLRVFLLGIPLLLFIVLVTLGALTSDHRREPWLAFSTASVAMLVYLPFAFFMILWDTGC